MLNGTEKDKSFKLKKFKSESISCWMAHKSIKVQKWKYIMLNGNEPFHALLLLFEAGEGGISDRKSGIGCIWVMVHILQKRKLLHILIQFQISFFNLPFCPNSLRCILIFSNDPQYLPSFKGKYFCDSNELIVFLWLKKFFILSFVQNDHESTSAIT